MTQSQIGTPSLRLVVCGQVAEVRRKSGKNGDVYLTLLKTPALDKYSSPGTFEVRSRRPLGQRGTEIEVECDLLGYQRNYTDKDNNTVRTAEHVLQAS